MDKKLKAALKQSFSAPPTQQKEEFINSISYPKETFCNVLLSQIFYIRKRVWFVFAAIVSFACIYTNHVPLSENITTVLSALLPLFSLCAIMELYKSAACNMAEIELTCKYNLSKITLMRLGILGTISFMILVLCVMLANKNDFGAFRNLIYLGVPYLLSSYLSLAAISKFKSKETIYVCAAISGAVSIFIVVINNSCKLIYDTDFTIFWAVSFIILTALMGFGFMSFKNSQEELQWNLL